MVVASPAHWAEHGFNGTSTTQPTFFFFRLCHTCCKILIRNFFLFLCVGISLMFMWIYFWCGIFVGFWALFMVYLMIFFYGLNLSLFCVSGYFCIVIMCHTPQWTKGTGIFSFFFNFFSVYFPTENVLFNEKNSTFQINFPFYVERVFFPLSLSPSIVIAVVFHTNRKVFHCFEF